jgi:glycosyltransferase involved in cell wall biosynthesis
VAGPAVSLVLPCYNASATLDEAIASIRGQTFEDWELLLFDDGSTDGSLSIARTHEHADGRVRVLSSEHVGIVEALRLTCAAARGAFLARMDADDVSYPERLAKQVAFMEDNPHMALCGTGVEMVGPSVGTGRRRYEDWLNRLVDHEGMVRELFVECPLAHPTFFLRRADYEAVGAYQDHGWAEDYDLCMRLYLAGKQFGKVPETLLAWRDTGKRLSMTDERYGAARFRALKRHYLLEGPLRSERPFYQWGAGEVGKRWLREWQDRRPEAVVDINPRKIGTKIHGFQVIEAEELPPPGTALILAAVGAPGARDDIRAWLDPRGYVEGVDYLFVA